MENESPLDLSRPSTTFGNNSYLRSHFWSNRFYKTWEDLKVAAADAWRRVCLVPDLVKTVCADTAVRAVQ